MMLAWQGFGWFISAFVGAASASALLEEYKGGACVVTCAPVQATACSPSQTALVRATGGEVACAKPVQCGEAKVRTVACDGKACTFTCDGKVCTVTCDGKVCTFTCDGKVCKAICNDSDQAPTARLTSAAAGLGCCADSQKASQVKVAATGHAGCAPGCASHPTANPLETITISPQAGAAAWAPVQQVKTTGQAAGCDRAAGCCGKCCCCHAACSGTAAGTGAMPRALMTGGATVAAGTGAGAAVTPAFAYVTASDGAGVHQPRVTWVGGAAAAQGVPSGAWLGVQLGDVSDVITAQLGLESGQGVTILNVVKDSPAEKAGLERFDVISAVDGQPISGGVADFVEKVSAMKAGDRLGLTAHRGGRTMTLTAELSERRSEYSWKYDAAPDVTAQDSVNVRGRVIRPDASGAWIVEDIEDMKDLDDLPEVFKMYLPKGQNTVQRFWFGDEGKSIRIERTVDGESLVVEQSNDGEIHVVRRSAGGDEKTTAYANREELRKGDPEAAEMLEGQGVHVYTDGHGLPGRFFGSRFGGADPQYMQELHERLAEAEKAVQDALRDVQERWKRFDDDGAAWREPMSKLHDLLQDRGSYRDGASAGRARQSFRVNPDGSIEVVIRKGDSEVTRVFQNEGDLQRRDGALYERYRDVMERD
ncbi:MAG: hypothetical protein FLDDKLPJ_03151 [Phycisphaerae bacterium]|nr:hypothetical protein [Phycisphaerae bacterium]